MREEREYRAGMIERTHRIILIEIKRIILTERYSERDKENYSQKVKIIINYFNFLARQINNLRSRLLF